MRRAIPFVWVKSDGNFGNSKSVVGAAGNHLGGEFHTACLEVHPSIGVAPEGTHATVEVANWRPKH
jgi:hypothetical protein